MKKQLMKLLAILCMFVCFMAGCSNNKSDSESEFLVDTTEMEAFAGTLATEITYDYPLADVFTEDSFDIFFNDVPDGTKGFLYLSATSSAEMVAVITCKDSDSAAQMETQISAYMDDEYKEFQKYGPKEAAKLEKRIVIRKGTLVLASVSPETDKANELIKKFLEEH